MAKTKELQYFGNDGDQYTQVDPGSFNKKVVSPNNSTKADIHCTKKAEGAMRTERRNK